MADAAFLSTIAVFGGLPDSEQSLLSGLLEERCYAAGALVVEENAPGRELYVLEEGQAEVLKRTSDGRQVSVADLGPGACFGEMAFVGIMRRSATVRARSPLRALILPYAKIATLAEQHPRIFTVLLLNLARELCRRLERTDALLGEFGIQAPRHLR